MPPLPAGPGADDVLARVLDAARWAPTGGNRQGVRFSPCATRSGEGRCATRTFPALGTVRRARAGKRPGAPLPKLVAAADHMARHLDEVPVLLVVCAHLGDLLATDRHLDRLTVVGGASIYPSLQNVLLAARAEGLGTALTTLLCAVEPQVKELLDIPADVLTAALVPLGYPVEPFPKEARAPPAVGDLLRRRVGRAAFR